MPKPVTRASFAAILAVSSVLFVAPAAQADATTQLTNSGPVMAASSVQVAGAADPSTSMSVTLQLGSPSSAEAERLLDAGTVLTPAEYASRFGASDAAISKVVAWAGANGLTVDSTSVSSGQVVVHAPVNAINRAFHVTEKHGRLHGVDGLTVTEAPSVPSSLGLTGVAGLNTLARVAPAHAQQPDSGRRTLTRPPKLTGTKPTSDGSADCATTWGEHLYPTGKMMPQESNYLCGYTPQNLQTMYGSGSGASLKPKLGILLWGGDADIQATTNEYMKDAGYPVSNDFRATIEPANAGMSDCGPNTIQSEQALDVQSTHAIAPAAAIRYYGAASCYDADLTAELQKMVDAHEVSTISMSFAEPADDAMTQADQDAWNRPLLQAALTGISTFAATGDNGNNSTVNTLGFMGSADGKPHVGFPASSAYTTAVGGTSVGLSADGSQVATGWEDAFFQQPDATKKTFTALSDHPVSGAGGGVSAVVAQPSWQKGRVSGSTTMRAVPDIAALGDPYTGFSVRYRTYNTDSSGEVTGSQVAYSTLGGTSLATPIVAAMTGLAKEHNHSQVGLITPLLYRSRGSMLTDVKHVNAGVFFPSATEGNEVVQFDGSPQNLAARPGWDNVTGWGTPYGTSYLTAIK